VRRDRFAFETIILAPFTQWKKMVSRKIRNYGDERGIILTDTSSGRCLPVRGKHVIHNVKEKRSPVQLPGERLFLSQSHLPINSSVHRRDLRLKGSTISSDRD